MLQQTRVAAVLEHYRKFLVLFPTVDALAAAPPERVLAAWSGLGYYRRARSLHQAAQVVANELGGKLPRTSEGWRALPGIGRYTAAAIASIAFGEATAVVDGNVERVLARLYGVAYRGEALWQHANEVLAPARAGEWNQAMMELGATVCTPQTPRCLECPLHRWCKTRGEGVRKPQAVRNRRHVACAFARRGEKVCLVQREADDSLMPGMWELPLIDADGRPAMLLLRHSITSTDYSVDVYQVSLREVRELLGARRGKWFAPDALHEVALTGLAKKALRKLGLLS